MLFFVFSGFAVVRAACAPLLMHEGSLAADEDKKVQILLGRQQLYH
jgi:hypothetical protein